ncbi:hypothetical protein [Bordetella hinzii]|uniref:hypothetical protein n=1 Tax=Bordetella hinzii TaxID=103855 RepID=UPI001C03A0C3|nr:hypothetical protein [Bordetella hinzii]QWF40084.1 hypothetical protein HHA25_18305 [Bordetella hinzii]QWF44629.1 hypothetical protein HHA24_18295 [Bordetella hinzii]QWF49166.1 hypothetical protein HHA23_18295 [Bordetella hinzii]QWF53702.1 hypothetical protein HHA22_18300 [Bordetella hinzii]QWF58192.1 hypothetical protein HHA21_18055 [Bordetella hinzii]
MKQEIIRLLERAKEDGRTIGDVLAEVRGIAEPVAAQAPIPEGQQPYPPTPAPDVQSSGEAEDSYSRAAVERAMRAAHDRGYSVGWDHGHAAQAPAAAMPDEIEGLRAHVALLKSALAQSERENDELRALAAAGDAQPAVWVAADTLNSPHPTCISSLAYMSQIDQNRGREYVPLYAAPVAAQTADDARDADMFWNADDPEQFSATDLQGAVEYIMDDYRPSDLPMELDLLCARSMPNVQVRVTGYNEADGWQYEVVDAAIAAQVQQQGEA